MSVVPASDYKETEIQKLIHVIMKKSSVSISQEYIMSTSIVWMPYCGITYEYKRSEKETVQRFGEISQSETAINAMFCECTRDENELIMLFRPNYLKYEMTTYSPKTGEIIGPAFDIDFEAVLSGFLKKLNEVKEEFHKLRSTLNKRYVKIRRYSMILPVRRDLKEGMQLSEKTGKLGSRMNILGMCLNLGEDAESIRVLCKGTFYYPTAIVALKHRKSGIDRFLIVNLVKEGSIRKTLNFDEGLIELCNNNDACKEVLARSFAHT